MEDVAAVVGGGGDVVAGLEPGEDGRVVDFIVHGHGGHPAVDFFAVDGEPLGVLVDGDNLAVKSVRLSRRGGLAEAESGSEDGGKQGGDGTMEGLHDCSLYTRRDRG
jgi:hypothetical protein